MIQPARIEGLGARVHLFVQPAHRDLFTTMFRDVLGCETVERDFGLEFPILLVRFPDGSAFSVEFTTLAAADYAGDTIDDANARHDAWIEFRTGDLAGHQKKLRDAGIRTFRHPGSSHTYFSAPGGQVFRLLALDYEGP